MFAMIWKLLLDIDRGLFWGCAALFIPGMIFGARGRLPASFDRPVKELSDGRVVLRSNWLGLSWFGMLITILPTSLLSYLRGHPNWLVTAPVCFFAGSVLFMIPGTITLGSEGLQEHFWLWKDKRIRWGDIVEIESDPKGRSLTIKAVDGKRIVHSSFLSGRPRLLREIKTHCGENLPADFPCEPLENA